jgi:hypothetical protein
MRSLLELLISKNAISADEGGGLLQALAEDIRTGTGQVSGGYRIARVVGGLHRFVDQDCE